MLSKKKTNLLSKKQKELKDLRCKRKKNSCKLHSGERSSRKWSCRKSSKLSLQEEEKFAAEREKRRLEYEERERQRKVEDDRKSKAMAHLGDEQAKKQGREQHDDSSTASGRKSPFLVSKPQHPPGNMFTKPPPYQPGSSSRRKKAPSAEICISHQSSSDAYINGPSSSANLHYTRSNRSIIHSPYIAWDH